MARLGSIVRGILAVTGLLWSSCDASFSTEVESGSEQCFTVRVPNNIPSTIAGDFDLLDDELSPDPLNVILYNNDFDIVWHSESGATEGSFRFPKVTGRHLLCIQNGKLGKEEGSHDDGYDDTVDDGEERTVGFALRVIPPSHVMEEEGPDEHDALLLMERAEALYEDLAELEDHQGYLREREAAHREIIEKTFAYIWRWTLLEAFVVCAISTSQVLYLRKFFETRRYL